MRCKLAGYFQIVCGFSESVHGHGEQGIRMLMHGEHLEPLAAVVKFTFS